MKSPLLFDKPKGGKSIRTNRRPRSRASIVRALRRALPALSEKYNIKSFGIFGSYARGEQKATSDLDVLVEYQESPSYFTARKLEQELSKLVGTNVDSHEPQNLRTYIGKNVLHQVLWLQKDGAAQRLKAPRRTHNGKCNGGNMAEPKRDYLDFIQDMIESMENAPLHVAGKTYEQMVADRSTRLLVRTEIQLIGEAASRIPEEFQEQYPEIPWKSIVGARHRIVHGYDKINYKEVWRILQESIPHDLPLVRAMLQTEMKRRGIDDTEKTEPAD